MIRWRPSEIVSRPVHPTSSQTSAGSGSVATINE